MEDCVPMRGYEMKVDDDDLIDTVLRTVIYIKFNLNEQHAIELASI